MQLRTFPIVLASCALTLVLAGCNESDGSVASDAPRSAAAAADGDAWLLYEREGEVYKISETGDGATALSNKPKLDEFEWEWLPDGSGAIYEQFKDTGDGFVDNNIMWVSADASEDDELEAGSEPSVGPDGRIVFVRTNADGNTDLWIMNSDGTGLTQLTKRRFNDRSPAWSPDGTRIVFERKVEGDKELWTIKSNGKGLAQLTHTKGYDPYSPIWAPDGTAVAFELEVDYKESADDAKVSRIGYVGETGGNTVRLGKGAYGLLLGGWEPNSKSVLYTNPNSGKLFSTEVASGETSTLTTADGISYASWTPDGEKISFVASDASTESDEIFMLDVATDDVSALTETQDFEGGPLVWYDPTP